MIRKFYIEDWASVMRRESKFSEKGKGKRDTH